MLQWAADTTAAKVAPPAAVAAMGQAPIAQQPFGAAATTTTEDWASADVPAAAPPATQDWSTDDWGGATTASNDWAISS